MDVTDKLEGVLRRAWRSPFAVSSDFARSNAHWVAAAACMGLITTRIAPDRFGRTWHITTSGMRMINEMEID